MSPSDISATASELSARHIPDMDTLSSTSFSFQIPAANSLLADEDENDFFRNAGGTDVSLTLTHVSPFSPAHASPANPVERRDIEDSLLGLRASMADPPLLSPGLAVDNVSHKLPNQRPKLSLNIRPLIQAVQTSPVTSFPRPTQELPISTVTDQAESNHPLLESKNTAAYVLDGPETKTKPAKKKVEINAKEQGRKKDILRTQRKIVEGGIAKSRIATSKKTRELPPRGSSTLPLGPMRLPAPYNLERPVVTEDPTAEALLADSSTSSVFPMTGIASRLIQYGQKYIDTFRDQIDTNVPTEKPTVTLDCPPDPTTQGPSNTTQGRGEDPNNCSILPMKRIADSLVLNRKKVTDKYPNQNGTNISTENGLDPQLGPIIQEPSIVQKTQERSKEDAYDDNIEDDGTKPLTLSQLSPRKQRTQSNAKPPTPITTSGADVSPPSPMRPATKRPVAAESVSEEPKLKRSKGDEPNAKKRPTKSTMSKRKPNPKPRVQSGPSQPRSLKPTKTLSGSGSSSTLKKSDSSVTAIASKPAGVLRTKSRIVSSGKQAAGFNPGTGWNDNVLLSEETIMRRSNSSLKLSGSSLKNSRIQNESRQDDKALVPSSTLKSNGAPQPTELIPEESDSRSTSRSHSNSQSYKHKFYHPAPNFKAIHAAFDASIAQRKENIQPTVPLAMRWETDSRMQERKKFEERVREKEREKEKEEDERRRLRETEEEQALKELRKKMVVKAHEVPEWYNERPKTKKRQEQDMED